MIKRLAIALCTITATGTALADEVVDIAGVYSTRHKVTVEGRKVEIEGYLDIDLSGKITVYGAGQDGKICYFPARGNAIDSGLQGLTFEPGTSPDNEPDYQVTVGQDTFGILTQPDPKTGKMRWFFHGGKNNNTVTITGSENIVNASSGSFSITLPRLNSPTSRELRTTPCE